MLFSLMFFLSALDVSGRPASFEKLSHVKACVNSLLVEALLEQSEDCNAHQDATAVPSQVLFVSTLPQCGKTKRVFNHTFCNCSRTHTYLAFKMLRI